MHRPDAGSILVDGLPLEAIPADRLRRAICLLTQETHVSMGTLADNLRLAQPCADAAALRHALRTVGAESWLAGLPSGLDTPVGAGANQVTAGQAQQLALARVLLADPAIVILDEATANLDLASARRIQRALDAALQGRTVVVIAHRLQAAATADRVAVIDGGRITELGTHAELLARHAGYAAL